MKGGVAVQLAVAAALTRPSRDITWVFYDNEEVEAARNGLGRVARNEPKWLEGDLAILKPELVVLPTGSVKRFMADIGNTSVQTKFPRILDDERRDILRSYVH
jgi:succinyl-diaminopimelate desuccinylase